MSGRVVMSDRFTRTYSELDGSMKNRVLDFIVKLQERPDLTGLDLKAPEGVADPRIRTARVTDFWRAVLIELPESNGFVLAAVKPHDDAYTYAERLRVGVNEVTGALDVVDAAALDDAITHAHTAGETSGGDTGTAPQRGPVLDGVRVRDLRRFGVDTDIAERLVEITDESRLLSVAEELPGVQANAVLDLAAGRTVDDVWADLIAEEEPEIDTGDLLKALERPQSRLVFTDGSADELRAALEGEFTAWRVWLHPLQRRLADKDGWRGPYRVTGGAGTGKTVTAVHRARHLADRLARAGSDEKVLFTTYTRNLARNIESQLTELAGQDILKRVEVVNIDALAYRVLRTADDRQTRPRQVPDDAPDVVAAWETARADATEAWETAFLQAEWNQVVLAQGLAERGDYLRAPRSGRGRRLSRPQRAELWAVFERFTQQLNARNLLTFTQAAARAATVARQLDPHDDPGTDSGVRRAALPRYRHGVVDEAQDLHPAHWRLVRALVPRGADDLFLVGDAHQRIYGKPLVLSHYGIETRGRSRRLTVNYRTSRQILDWSLRVAYGHAVDDLEGGADSLAGARSEFAGPEPRTAGFDTAAAEKAALVEVVRDWHGAGLEWSQIAVVTRSNNRVAELAGALTEAEVPAAEVGRDTDEHALGDVVRVMTMHRAKGLEYRAVALVGAGRRDLPPRAARELDGDDRDAARARERGLLYVAGSRAREHLYLSWTGEPSELLG